MTWDGQAEDFNMRTPAPTRLRACRYEMAGVWRHLPAICANSAERGTDWSPACVSSRKDDVLSCARHNAAL